MAAEGRIRENLYQQMENLNKFAKFYTNKIKPLYGNNNNNNNNNGKWPQIIFAKLKSANHKNLANCQILVPPKFLAIRYHNKNNDNTCTCTCTLHS